jgi:hypothetical protein
MVTFAAHSIQIMSTYAVMDFIRPHDATLCRKALTAVKMLQAIEKPNTKVAMYMSFIVGAGTLYHGGTRNPGIAYDSFKMGGCR